MLEPWQRRAGILKHSVIDLAVEFRSIFRQFYTILGVILGAFLRPKGLPGASLEKARKKNAKKAARLCQNHDFGPIPESPGVPKSTKNVKKGSQTLTFFRMASRTSF